MVRREGKRTVLRVFPSAVYGGPQNEAAALSAGMLARGYELFALVPREPGDSVARLREAGVKVMTMDLARVRRVISPLFWLAYPVRWVRDVIRLTRLIRRNEVDLVVGSSVNLQAAFAARITGTPVVWEVSDVSTPRGVRRMLSWWLRRLADVVLVDGARLLDFYPGLRALGERAVVYYPPVDTDRFRPNERAADQLAERDPLVGTVANLNPDKGLEYLVAAASQVRARTRARFVVVGAEHPGHERYAARLRALIEELGLADSFELVGPQRDIPAWLGRMDLFAISSVYEGTTTTALEAMASGLPVVATEIGAVADVVADGQVGKLVPARDPDAMARAIEELLHDHRCRLDLGAAARSRVVGNFGLERTLAAQVEAFRIAVERRGSSG